MPKFDWHHLSGTKKKVPIKTTLSISVGIIWISVAEGQTICTLEYLELWFLSFAT